MKNSKKLLLSAVVLPFVFGSVSVFAHNPHHNDDASNEWGWHDAPHHQGKEQHNKKGHRGGNCMGPGLNFSVIQKLDLTEAQKEQMKALHQAHRDEMKKDGAKWFEKRQQQHEKTEQLVLADTFDNVAANKLAKEAAEQQVTFRVSMLKKQHQMLNILTPEQKTKFQTLKSERLSECKASFEKHMLEDKAQ